MPVEHTPFRGRRALFGTLWILLVVANAAALFLCRYEDPRRISFSGDSYWYLRQAQMFAGVSEVEAAAEASRLLCLDINRSSRDQGLGNACREYSMAGISPRYVAIFDQRPGYPLFAAPFVAALGAWNGMVTATFGLAMIAAVLAYLAVWLATGLRLAGVAASAFLFVLPSGFWMTRMLAESAVIVGYLAVLIGAMLLWRGRMSGLPVLVMAFGWLFVTRSASGAAAAISLLAASAAMVIFRFRPRRGPLVTGGMAAVVLAVWFALSAAFGLPGLNETIQDFATRHFILPDIDDPIDWLIRKNLMFWPDQPQRIIVRPWTVVAALFAVAVLFRRLGHVAWLWLILGATGAMMLVAHPANGEQDRMMLTMWLPVSCAAGYAAALALRRNPITPPETQSED